MGRPLRQLPAELARAPWPEHAAADPFAEVARQFALNLRAAIEARSLRAVAQLCGVSHTTLVRILNGQAWPDLFTIARLEAGLQTSLWPRWDAG